MKFIIYFGLLPLIFSLSIKNNEDCWINNNNTITNKYGILVNFSPDLYSDKESCSMKILNPWSIDMHNGFGVFLPRAIDCSLTITIQCLSDDIHLEQSIPSIVQYTCHTNSNKVQMSCNLIEIIFKRNSNTEEIIKSASVQIVALAKAPCVDNDILFQCLNDYPNSCINKNLRCNGRSECPSGDDEYDCHPPSPAGIPIIAIVFGVLALLFLLCIFSTVLIFCCCRATWHVIIRHFRSFKKNQKLQKGDITIATGEDAGLMKCLTTPNVIQVLPEKNTEPTTLIIDSTKPVYPRLE